MGTKKKTKKELYSCTVTIYDDNSVGLSDKASNDLLVTRAVSKHLTLGLLRTMARRIEDTMFNNCKE